MGFNIKNNIYLVGNVDWEIESYQGYKYSTHKGSSYNAYLIKEKKNVLIDTNYPLLFLFGLLSL